MASPAFTNCTKRIVLSRFGRKYLYLFVNGVRLGPCSRVKKSYDAYCTCIWNVKVV